MRHGGVIVGTTDAALSELNIELSAGGRTWLSGAHSIGSTQEHPIILTPRVHHFIAFTLRRPPPLRE